MRRGLAYSACRQRLAESRGLGLAHEFDDQIGKDAPTFHTGTTATDKAQIPTSPVACHLADPRSTIHISFQERIGTSLYHHFR